MSSIQNHFGFRYQLLPRLKLALTPPPSMHFYMTPNKELIKIHHLIRTDSGEIMEQEICGIQADIEQDICGIKADMEQDICGIQADMEQDICGIQADMEQEICGILADMEQDICGIQADM